jgi:hypothetical protein
MYSPPSQGSIEQVLFQAESDGIVITTARVRFGSAMYPIAGITMVQAVAVPPNRGMSVGLVAVGGIFLALAAMSETLVMVGFALLPLFAGILTYAIAKTNYTVRIATAGAQIDAYSTSDQFKANSISVAIQNAIVNRR